MPRKTKKQKIAALLHKTQRQIMVKEEPSIQVEIPVNEESTKVDIQPKDNTIDSSDYFKKDLVKSVAFIVSIISLEILLYFATMNNYFKSILAF